MNFSPKQVRILTTNKKLLLASGSPRRRELIQLLGLPVEIVENKAEECIEPDWTPETAVENLSNIKAQAGFETIKVQKTNGLLIGADTIVVLKNQILGKPRDREHAFEMLTALQGNTHRVLTGITLIDLETQVQVTTHEETKVWMKPLDQDQIWRYIDSGEPMDKAGSYGIQNLGATLISRIEGDYFNVVGLPLSCLADNLKKFGYIIP